MTSLIQKKFLYFGIITALIFESVSFIAFFLPEYSVMLAIVLTMIFLALTSRDIRLGIFLLFTELAIGGHGYFLSLSLLGEGIALRHVWFISLFILFLSKEFLTIRAIVARHELIRRLLFVALIGVLATIIGYARGTFVADIFSDGNAYLFYLLIVPFIVYRNSISKENLLSVLFGALVILSLKTLLTLIIFSNGLLIASEWYTWVRDLRFGEITYIDFAFYRVFFQSQVFLLPALAIIGSYIYHKGTAIIKYERWWLYILSSLFVTSFLLSFSRSFWVGALVGVLVFIVLAHTYRKNIISHTKIVLKYFSAALITSLILLAAAQSFSLDTSLFIKRLTAGEAAIASRWALLPRMIDEVVQAPIFGGGFGKSVKYISHDPRILSATKGTGEYTTFSFEWGYIDFWLKMGIIGLLALIYLYRYFLSLQVKNMRLQADNWYAFGITISLFMLFVLHFFTPYLNHPLGIGYLVLGLL
jgi:hypothetical protein